MPMKLPMLFSHSISETRPAPNTKSPIPTARRKPNHATLSYPHQTQITTSFSSTTKEHFTGKPPDAG